MPLKEKWEQDEFIILKTGKGKTFKEMDEEEETPVEEKGEIK